MRAKAGNVKKSSMVKPRYFSAFGVCGSEWTHLDSAYPVLAFPLNLDQIAEAIVFCLRATGRLKYSLPGQAKAIIEVSYVHPSSFNKLVSKFWIDTFDHSSAIGDWSLTTFLRGQ